MISYSELRAGCPNLRHATLLYTMSNQLSGNAALLRLEDVSDKCFNSANKKQFEAI